MSEAKVEYTPVTDTRVHRMTSDGEEQYNTMTVYDFVPHPCHKDFEYLNDTHIRFGEIHYKHMVERIDGDSEPSLLSQSSGCIPVAFSGNRVSIAPHDNKDIAWMWPQYIRWIITEFLLNNNLY